MIQVGAAAPSEPRTSQRTAREEDEMLEALRDQKVRQVLSMDGDDVWRRDLDKLRHGDPNLTRRNASDDAVEAIQRLLIFLGYSTTAGGGFSIDGDFGRGTNRGVAQFKFEHGLNSGIKRRYLCYPCTFNSARGNIVAIPEVRLDLATIDAMLRLAKERIRSGEVTLGRFDDALFQLNQLHRGRFLKSREIAERYGEAADRAVARIEQARGFSIAREWILAIIRQETAGVVRPRFEQHKLSAANAERPRADFAELRIRSMSIGLGQIMGFNHDRVGAPSAREMLISPVDDQVLYVARFIAGKKNVVTKTTPDEHDYRALARFYNGPAYEKHHYHEKLEQWFVQFRRLA
jgi:hypothetical protein